MNQVIENFINELTSRINLLNTMGDNLDSSRVDKINTIIDKYGSIDTAKYTKDDIDAISDVLRITDNDPIKSDYIALDKAINDFIEEYNVIKVSHEDNLNSSTSLYKKYVDLLSEDNKELFVDYEELNNIMSDLGISIADKWQIIKYLDTKNIKNNESNILAINLNSKLIVLNNLYLSDDNLKEVINDYIKDKSIDISMIPGLTNKIANDTYDKDKVRNALGTLILNELYQQLLESQEDNYDILQKMVNETLSYIDSYEDMIIAPSKEIVINYDEILNEEINKGNDLETYIDISLDDINALVNDKDKALTLKRLPIIKSIKDTLDNMNNCDRTSEDYINYIKLLSNLNEAYKEIKEV